MASWLSPQPPDQPTLRRVPRTGRRQVRHRCARREVSSTLTNTDSINAVALAHYAQTLAAKADQAGVLFAPPSAQVEDRAITLQAMVVRRVQLIGMRTAEKNRLGGAIRVLHKSIAAVLKTLDKQIALLDRDIDAHLDKCERWSGSATM